MGELVKNPSETRPLLLHGKRKAIRKYKKAKAMTHVFEGITWGTYLLAAGTATAVYYLAIGALYYRNEFSALLSGKPGERPGKDSEGATGGTAPSRNWKQWCWTFAAGSWKRRAKTWARRHC